MNISLKSSLITHMSWSRSKTLYLSESSSKPIAPTLCRNFSMSLSQHRPRFASVSSGRRYRSKHRVRSTSGSESWFF